ncbi:MAG TPA: glycerol-3-phosphate dehydrogenase/oxidase [Acidimicrobiales bacterium]|nr:glycerol-3-phosphate dehydrogenase/oxidase [Acidimicrobiales bacterium]
MAVSPARQPLTPFDRGHALDRLGDEPFDVLVVGGGITGAGVALDAAARGLKTALVERGDFAGGTSSKSSKLVHGGLRYLQQREIRLVYENLAERQRLLCNAPHLVTPLPFLIPLFGSDGVVNRAVSRAYSSALWLYDLTGGLRIGRRHRRIGVEDALAHVPTLRTDRLVAGYIYYDARTDDARLTLAIARTAVLDHGAVAANYAPVTALRKDDGRVCGARLDVDGAGPLDVRASAVVNATGVWADDVRALDEGAHPRSIRPAKGVHVTVPRDKLPCDIAAVLPVPSDRRSVFVVPWGDEVYVGTTDTDYSGPLDDPRCEAEDVEYVLAAVNSWVTRPLSPADVTGVWAGLRPLLADPGGRGARRARTADLSRRHQVTVSPSGVVSVTGGKLTTYRKMAADTVDEVVGLLGHGRRKSRTASMPLRGAAGTAELRAPDAAVRLGADESVVDHLVGRYGGEARAVLAIVDADPAMGEPLVQGLSYLRAEAVYAARYEMVHTLEDVLSRRTRATLHDQDAAADAAADIAGLVAPELGWTPPEVERQIAIFREAVDGDRAAAHLVRPHAGRSGA